MLVTYSDFVGELSIPNTDNADVVSNLNWFINKYEPECLSKIMGVDLYEVYKTVPVPPIEQRWLDLINGKIFVNNNGDNVVWTGLKNLIANYVYFFYMKDKTTLTMGVAEAIIKAAEWQNMSRGDKMIRAWNEFSSQTKVMVNYLLSDSNDLIYPEFTLTNGFSTIGFSRRINEFGI